MFQIWLHDIIMTFPLLLPVDWGFPFIAMWRYYWCDIITDVNSTFLGMLWGIAISTAPFALLSIFSCWYAFEHRLVTQLHWY